MGELQNKLGWPRQVPEGVAERPFLITSPVSASHFVCNCGVKKNLSACVGLHYYSKRHKINDL